ncbi:hypothetical protein CR983_00660 [Candidatus Saccharibacteria bacterium]|nr:MAG: hypothetical protein CR983_00660 [Candidatus Saccharibacteria bacterium]
MNVYFAGIGGVGIGPLAHIARKAGYRITGSDESESPVTRELAKTGATIHIGAQTGEFLRQQQSQTPFDYFVYTAALPPDHPELATAHQLGLRCVKRDGLLARILSDKRLDMIAIAGTHGKTTTTGLLVWVMKQLSLPVSYSVGTTLSFGPSGDFDPESELFVYECDEYDRNFLHYTPRLSVITAIDYDHPDTYPTEGEYIQAFCDFINQSDKTLLWQKDLDRLAHASFENDVTAYEPSTQLAHIHLPGLYLRQNAFLVERAVLQLFPQTPYHDLIEAINQFPGTSRRMERLDELLYSDYAHHPDEIRAALQAAREIAESVVAVYQPHQNVRQHRMRDLYTDCMELADEVYWLPTYLTREDPDLPVLSPEELAKNLTNHAVVKQADLNDQLIRDINAARSAGKLVVCMGAGSIDSWVRQHIVAS